jgi:pimeloyl-ACP methyl ester carboxylesterase
MTMTVFDRALAAGDAGRVTGEQERPDPEVPERARRRMFTAQYKLDVVAEYDAAAAARPLIRGTRRSPGCRKRRPSWSRPRADAVELFMVEGAEVPAEAVAAMRLQPSWSDIEAVAPTLPYEAAVMGPGNTLPAGELAAITQPALVLTGGNSPAWITKAGKAVARTIPGAVHRVLDGQTHNVSPRHSPPNWWNSSPPEQRRSAPGSYFASSARWLR